MNRPYLGAACRPLMTLGLVAMLGAGLAACQSPEQRRAIHLAEDTGTCADFGARQGSRAYTECMLSQQTRRDNEKLNALERQRISTQNSKDSLEMVRKIECDREARKEREAGLRPRRCD
ncbi:hypothetical protein SOM61_05215 [Massilia sp. CFBP9012]|uniref:hypothetical protein n=1 Tax=Massilia sp. CFBP9012 TaxID=3096531 RepID=UPI002A6991C9|nr:hypothetical protein [Massilia sp. CFBP9012]MDY0974356.1 hypothetical protein [Massilia sp. CFBP9012]